MPSSRRTLQDRINASRSSGFIGRKDQLRAFTDNFVDDEPAHVIFTVIGQGGVGKTTLLNQFEIAAKNAGALVARANDEQQSAAATMGQIAKQLRTAGFEYAKFDERYKTLQALQAKVESDPKAPRGAVNLIVRGMTDFAIKSARRAPGVGVFAEYVDEKQAGEIMAEGFDYVINRLSNKDETDLVREPEAVLSPHFVDLLNKACNNKRLVLMFDVFERTGDVLSPWLLALLNGKFGSVSGNIVFVIAGRDALHTFNQDWLSLTTSEITCANTLEVFTEEETRAYLALHKITDGVLVKEIHDDSAGLPVLLELIASTNPQPGQPLPDVSKEAVERIFRWIQDDEQRHTALIAAVARQFNMEILAAAVGKSVEETRPTFTWLNSQAFIRRDDKRGYYYHERVRELVIRYWRNTEPSKLLSIHCRLADHFVKAQESLALGERDCYENNSWRRCELERIYHRICATSQAGNGEALAGFLSAMRWRYGFASTVLDDVIIEGAHDADSDSLKSITTLLRNVFDAYDRDEGEKLVEAIGKVLLLPDLTIKHSNAIAYALAGFGHQLTNQFDQALTDFDHAIALDDKFEWAIAVRGETYRQIGDYPNALADLSRAIELNGKYEWAIAMRGETYRLMSNYPNALADLSRAIELNDKFEWAIATRGETHQLMGDYPNALADLSRAIELNDKFEWAIAMRGETYQLMGDYPNALADFSCSIELNDKDDWAIAMRGKTYRLMGDYPYALADLSRSIKLDDKVDWYFRNRAITHYLIEEYDAAGSDIGRAIELDDKDPNNYAWRAYILRGREMEQEAQQDIEMALTMTRDDAWGLYGKATAQVFLGRFDEALDLMREVIQREPHSKDDLLKNPIFATLRAYEGLQQFLNKLNHPDDLSVQ